MTTDPYSQYHSPYLAMGNRPISGVDPDGGKFFDWVEVGGSMIYDSGIKSQADANAKYGIGAKHHEVGTTYMSGGEEIILGALGTFTVNGDFYKSSDYANSSNYLDLETTMVGISLSVMSFDTYNSTAWKGKNGKYYQVGTAVGKQRPFYGNGSTGSVNIAKSKAAKIGMAGNILGAYSIAATHLEYSENIANSSGPNMTRHLNRRYKIDQLANATGFLGIYGTALSFGYNLGHGIEAMCNCNIQYNPYTRDFTPVEETFIYFDELGIDLNRSQ